MSATKVNRAISWTGQLLGYAAFCVALAYFATRPVYHPIPPGTALVKVSVQHAGQRKEPCRERSAEELAKLAPNMRTASVCPRERVPVAIEISLDGRTIVSEAVPPSGLAKDGSSTLYKRVQVPAGEHRIVAKLGDAPAPGFGHVKEATVKLVPGAILLIDFDPKSDGWSFRT